MSVRRHRTRYYGQQTPGARLTVARVTPKGASSWFDEQTGSWVNDPLLGAQVKLAGGWTELTPDELPAGAGDDSLEQDEPPRRLFGRRRRDAGWGVG